MVGAPPVPRHRWFVALGSVGRAWCVFGGAVVGSFLLYAVPILGRFSTSFVGQGSADAKLYVWDLAWWPHAIAAGLNPFHPTLVWAPTGVNMAWVTGLPGPSLAAWPLTATFGAVATSNAIAVASPALATWAAYLLCREVTRRFWPAVMGGVVFGFSTYQFAEMRGHMNLFLVFPVPLAAYLVLRYVHGRLSRRSYVLLLTAVLVAEFSISTEVFASMTMFAGMAALTAYLAMPSTRPLLRTAAGPTIVACGAAAAVLAPYLWYAAAGLPSGPIRGIDGSSSDLLSFLIPRHGTLVGGAAFARLTDRFPTNVSEDGAYLGPVLLLVLAAAFIAGRRERVTRWLFAFVALAAVLSMGAVLFVGPHRTIPMPWSVPARAPILMNVLPDRLTMYMWLGVALIVARWLSRPRPTKSAFDSTVRWGSVGLGVLLLIPNVHEAGLHRPIDAPRFFSAGLYRRVLTPNETILIVHDRRSRGLEMVLQEQSGFAFSMPQGHTGPEPEAFEADRLWQGVQTGRLPPAPDRFRLWLRQHHVGAIVVMTGSVRTWAPFLDAALGAHPRRIGGVLLYRSVGGSPALSSGKGLRSPGGSASRRDRRDRARRARAA